MNSAQINFKVKPEVKKKAAKLADQLGLSLSGLLNGYLHHFINTRSVHFNATGSGNEEFNSNAARALAESEKDYQDGRYHSFNNAKDAADFLEKISREGYED